MKKILELVDLVDNVDLTAIVCNLDYYSEHFDSIDSIVHNNTQRHMDNLSSYQLEKFKDLRHVAKIRDLFPPAVFLPMQTMRDRFVFPQYEKATNWIIESDASLKSGFPTRQIDEVYVITPYLFTYLDTITQDSDKPVASLQLLHNVHVIPNFAICELTKTLSDFIL